MQDARAIYSFGVFGTCLVRVYARPRDLYRTLAERMLVRRDLPFAREEIAEIARLRVRVEGQTRKASDREDIVLDEIYDNMSELESWGIVPRLMLREELALERESVRPISSTRTRVLDLHDQGERIIFISDTPLPRDAVTAALLDHDFPVPNDAMYTSGAAGLRKQTGGLFKHVFRAEEIEARQLVHFGDEKTADLGAPKALGVKVAGLCRSQLTSQDLRVIHHSVADDPVRSRAVGVSRAVRLLHSDDTDARAVTSLAANVAGPILTAFVAWTLTEAKRDGIERLYFVSRDGQGLLEIVDALSEYIPGPECRYLYGSRKAWLLPTVANSGPDKFEWTTRANTRPRQILKNLEIDPAEISEIVPGHGFEDRLDEKLDAKGLRAFFELLEQPEISALIRARAQAARELAISYLRQEELDSDRPWAMVDVGWSLSLQYGLRELLGELGCEDHVRGYYLGVAADRPSISQVGPYRAFLMSDDDEELVNSVWLRAGIFENAFLPPDHGSVTGYRRSGDGVEPTLGDHGMGDMGSRFRGQLTRALRSYAKEAAKSGLLEKDLRVLRQIALASLERFLSQPTREEARAIAWIRVTADPSHDEALSRVMARPLRGSDVGRRFLRRGFPRLASAWGVTNEQTSVEWPEGTLALSTPTMRSLYALAPRLRPRRLFKALVGPFRHTV